MTRRVGAYLLPGDPIWLRSSLSRYYAVLDDLVVLVPTDGIGWTGRPLPVAECLAIISEVDARGLCRTLTGTWVDREGPMRADTAQRQAGLDALRGHVDWVIQLDNDEVLPDIELLLRQIEVADSIGAAGIEWPMRVLFRDMGRGSFLEVCDDSSSARFDYPGPVLVRPECVLTDARRGDFPILRMAVAGDTSSLQLQRPPAEAETRLDVLAEDAAIWHNSWGRSARDIWRKVRTWGHASPVGGPLYFARTWLPAPARWRRARDFHPFAGGLWPRLRPVVVPSDLLADADRSPRPLRRTVWRTPARR